ncbi:MAG: hypothetical protein MJ245_05740 [Clostridia bacterium]|nr:hypothetical protein [Clostridia bacterium]
MKRMKLVKSLIVFTLVLSVLFTPVMDFVLPAVSFTTKAYASEVVSTDTENEAPEVFKIGVSRNSNLKQNQELFNENVMGVAKVIFAFVVFVVILLIGIDAITDSYDGKSRAQIIEKFKHIIYGVILFSIATLIVAVASQFQETVLTDLYDVQYESVTMPEMEDATLDTNWLANILEMGLKIIGRVLEVILQFLFSLVSGNGFDNALDNQYTLNNVLFLADFGDTIDLNAENQYGVKLTTAPFSVAEWTRYTKAYIFLATIAVPLMLLSVIKVAYDLVMGAGNFEKVTEVKKTVMRIISGIIIIALGPYLFRTVLTFFNMLVYLIPVEFSFDIIIEDIDDANGLLSVITSLWWLWIKFRIMLLFVVREIMLTVMYVITPIVIGFWTVSEKTKAFNRWIGETVTNAATQFCYALVFFIATVVLSGAQTNAFFTLLWMSMMLKVADFFKESFQNLFDKWSGINELQVSDAMAKSVRGFNNKLVNSTMDKIDPNRVGRATRGLSNVFALTDFAATGNVGGFTTRQMALQKAAKSAKADANDDLKIARENWKDFSDYKPDNNLDIADMTLPQRMYKLVDYAANKGYTGDEKKYLEELDRLRGLASGDKEKAIIENMYGAGKDLIKTKNKFRKATNTNDFESDLRKEDWDKTLGKLYTGALLDRRNELANPPKSMDSNDMTNLLNQYGRFSAKVGPSKITFDSEKFTKELQARGFDPRTATFNEQQEVAKQIVEPSRSAIRNANRAIENQDLGARSATDEIKKANIEKTNSAVQKALDSTLELYASYTHKDKPEDKELDNKMAKQLRTYANKLGANGQSDLQEKYIELIDKLSKTEDDD